MYIKLRNQETLIKKLKKFLDKRNWNDKVEKKLHIIGKAATQNIKVLLQASDLKTVDRLVQELKFEVVGTRLRVFLPVSHAKFLNYGTAPRQMLELEGKVVPIIVGSRIIFRTASRQSMAKGQWKHPGIAPKRFWERGLEKSLEKVPTELKTLPQEVLE